MRIVLLFVTFLIILPSIALAWPFAIHEGEQAAEFLLPPMNLMGASALMAAMSFTGLYAYRKRAEIRENGLVPASKEFITRGLKFSKDYALGHLDVYKDVAISSIKAAGTIIGTILDKAVDEEIEERIDNKEISQGIGLDFSKPISERLGRWVKKLDKDWKIPGEKKILDKGYFYDSEHRGRNLGHIMGELGVMVIPAPAVGKAGKYAQYLKQTKKVVTGIKVLRSAKYARSGINMLLQAPAAISNVVPKISSAIETVNTAKKTMRKAVVNTVINFFRR